VVALAAGLAGREARIRSLRRRTVSLLAPFSSALGELKELMYQWELPYRVDHSKWTARFGEGHTPLEEGLRATLDWHLGARRPAP
jgi:nucleoside-diphosphate-sugar epimerase